MKCRDVYRFICDNLDQPVDSPECMAMRRHVESCGDCQAYLESLKQTVSLYRRGADSGVPPAVHRRLMHALRGCFGPPSPGQHKSRTAARRTRHSR